MFRKKLLHEALRSIWSQRGRSFLASLGIIIGAATVVLVIDFGEGAKASIARQYSNMSATVRYITKQVDSVITIPNKAVKRVDGQSVVSYYDEQKKIVTKPVTTGFTDGTSVAITKGLGAGEHYLIIQ